MNRKLANTGVSEQHYGHYKTTERQQKESQELICSIKTQEGKWARNDSEKAETFAKHLEKIFRPYPGKIPAAIKIIIIILLNAAYQLDLLIKKCTIREVQAVIKNDVNRTKAPGYYGRSLKATFTWEN